MDDNESKAQYFIDCAEKKSKKGFLSFIFSENSDSLEEQISLYERAANCYKLARKWDEAGNTFCRAAQLSFQSKSRRDGATHYINASVAYRKTDPHKAVECLQKAVDIYIELGHFNIAARHHFTIAEIYEEELADKQLACKHYEQAADYYKCEEANSSSMKCMVKVAEFSATGGNIEKAASIFDQIGRSNMDKKLLRYGAKDYLTKAVICYFCLDTIKGQKTLQLYEESFPMFADSRECILLKKVSEALDQQDTDAFTAAIASYDSISRLDPWMTSMFLKVKKTMTEEDDIT